MSILPKISWKKKELIHKKQLKSWANSSKGCERNYFFENYTMENKLEETLNAFNNTVFSKLGITTKIFNYLKEKNYFKSEFAFYCRRKNDENKIDSFKNRQKNCVCQAIIDGAPRKFTKKSAVESKQFLSAVEHMLLDLLTECPELLGSHANVLQFNKNVKHILRFSKDQYIKTSLLTRKLKIKSVEWLNIFFEMHQKNKVFAEFCLSLFQMIQNVLLRHFYIGITRFSQPVFYLKQNWHGLVHLHENLLKAKLTPAVTPDVKARKIKWIPKSKTCFLRPIFLHRKNKKDGQDYETLNFILKSLLISTDLGFSRTTTKPSFQFQQKWKEFHNVWSKQGSPKMYVVKTDLEDAYGCVDQGQLLDTVNEWMLKEFSAYPCLSLYRSYNKKRHSRLYWFKEIVSTLPILGKEHDTPKLIKVFTGKELFTLVENALRELFKSQVKIGKHYFQYSSGILQGHPLSGYLCEIYYGQIYLNYHQKIIAHSEKPTLLLSAVDDMIFLTADKRLALRYLNFVLDKEQCPVNMNVAKLESNLCPLDEACTAGSSGSHHKTLFSFCGVNINAHTLNLSGSYFNYKGRNILHSFTFKKPGESYIRVIENKLNFFLSLKAHRMFFDVQINSVLTVARNIFEVGIHLACRFNSLAMNFCIENYVQPELTWILYKTLQDLSAHIAKKVWWHSYARRQSRILLILCEALVFITHKFDTLYELNRIALRDYLHSMLCKARSSVSDKDLEQWLHKVKKRSLLPRLLMDSC